MFKFFRCSALLTAYICFFSVSVQASPDTVKIWVMAEPNIPLALQAVSKKINEIDSNIILKSETVSWNDAKKIFSDREKFIETFKNNNFIPDIIQIPSTWAQHIMKLNILHPLTDAFGNNRNQNYLDNVAFHENVRYAYPWTNDIRVLYYRKDILNTFNYDIDSLKTWKNLIDICEKIRKQKIKIQPSSSHSSGADIFEVNSHGREKLRPVVISNYQTSGWNIIHNIIAPNYWSRTNGAAFPPSVSNENSLIDSLAEDIKLYKDLRKLVGIEDRYLSENEMTENFICGKYAFCFGSPLYIYRIREKWGLEWDTLFGITSIPNNKIGIDNYAFAGGSLIGVYNRGLPDTSKHMKNIMEILRLISTDTTVQTLYASNISVLPAIELNDGILEPNDDPYCQALNKIQNRKSYEGDMFYFEENFIQKMPNKFKIIDFGVKKFIKVNSAAFEVILSILAFIIGLITYRKFENIINKIDKLSKVTVLIIFICLVVVYFLIFRCTL